VETKNEELAQVKRELEDSKREISYLEKKSVEKDEFFLRSANRL
jgi:hypothetical protein